MTAALCIEQVRVQRATIRSCSMTEALCIDNLKDCAIALKHCGLTLKDAALTIKRWGAAIGDRARAEGGV